MLDACRICRADECICMDRSHKTRSTRIVSCIVQLTGMFLLPFFSHYRLPHKQWCELLLTCNGTECGDSINVRRTKTNRWVSNKVFSTQWTSVPRTGDYPLYSAVLHSTWCLALQGLLRSGVLIWCALYLFLLFLFFFVFVFSLF